MFEATAVTTQAAPDAPVTSATPTLTHYEEIAQDLSKAIDAMLALIPSFVEPHPTTKPFVDSHQSVSNDFIATTIAGCGAMLKDYGHHWHDDAQPAREKFAHKVRDVNEFLD